eukprot:GCRY01005793.1.p1 GENE.GCRY01005793.1~~GCRY01005793.1.p1  ORF type:complete len:315 (+),score=44.14 GCRY01005793.1:196-1140(+)
MSSADEETLETLLQSARENVTHLLARKTLLQKTLYLLSEKVETSMISDIECLVKDFEALLHNVTKPDLCSPLFVPGPLRSVTPKVFSGSSADNHRTHGFYKNRESLPSVFATGPSTFSSQSSLRALSAGTGRSSRFLTRTTVTTAGPGHMQLSPSHPLSLPRQSSHNSVSAQSAPPELSCNNPSPSLPYSSTSLPHTQTSSSVHPPFHSHGHLHPSAPHSSISPLVTEPSPLDSHIPHPSAAPTHTPNTLTTVPAALSASALSPAHPSSATLQKPAVERGSPARAAHADSAAAPPPAQSSGQNSKSCAALPLIC